MCIRDRGSASTHALSGLGGGRLRTGQKLTVADAARPVSYTHLDVYKRQTQHLKVLEQAGLIKSSKAGRVRTCSLDAAAMAQIELWIAQRKQFWERQYDQLDAYLAQTSVEEKE